MTKLTFTVTATTTLPAIAGKKTAACFIGRHWTLRDPHINLWLPENQLDVGLCTVTTLTPSSQGGWIFAEAVAKILGVSAKMPIVGISRLLIERGYTMTLPQAEQMVEKTEAGEDTGLQISGYANFVLVRGGDTNDPVLVGYINRDNRDWCACVRKLSDDNLWGADRRILLCNVDTSKLGI